MGPPCRTSESGGPELAQLPQRACTAACAYEANLEDGFQTLTCTLYQLENHVWKNLEEVVFDLRSPTLEFALSAYLDTAMVSVQMNDEENKGSGHIDIKEFKVIPSGSENDELLNFLIFLIQSKPLCALLFFSS